MPRPKSPLLPFSARPTARLVSVAPLGELLSLRQLDVSLNQLHSLEGLQWLGELTALAASGSPDRLEPSP